MNLRAVSAGWLAFLFLMGGGVKEAEGFVPSLVSEFIVGKGVNYVQYSSAGPVFPVPEFAAFAGFTEAAPLDVHAFVDLPLVDGESVREQWNLLRDRHGLSRNELFFEMDGTGFEERFSDGVYDFAIDFGDGLVFDQALTISGGHYPAAPPFITNTTWNAMGSLVVNPVEGFTLSWKPFAESTSEDVVRQFIGFDMTTSKMFVEEEVILNPVFVELELNLPADAVSLTFNPDGTIFYSDGTDTHLIEDTVFHFDINDHYEVNLFFVNVVDHVDEFTGLTAGLFDENAYGSGGYFAVTEFDLHAIPEPSTYALFGVGLLVVGFVLRRRRGRSR